MVGGERKLRGSSMEDDGRIDRKLEREMEKSNDTKVPSIVRVF